MRRTDREITDKNQMLNILEESDVCRLAFNDEGYPYILPLNFGIFADNNIVTLYFHGADKGRKYEIIEKDNRASFEVDCKHELIVKEEKGYCTMNYYSVIGKGTIEIVSDESEKNFALDKIVEHYHKEPFSWSRDVFDNTVIMKLTVTDMTAKRRIGK